MAVAELVPGKLYRQSLGHPYQSGGKPGTRTVMCVKYEQWRIYRKVVLLVMGQPNRPLVEEFMDKFQLKKWLESFEEINTDDA